MGKSGAGHSLKGKLINGAFKGTVSKKNRRCIHLYIHHRDCLPVQSEGCYGRVRYGVFRGHRDIAKGGEDWVPVWSCQWWTTRVGGRNSSGGNSPTRACTITAGSTRVTIAIWGCGTADCRKARETIACNIPTRLCQRLDLCSPFESFRSPGVSRFCTQRYRGVVNKSSSPWTGYYSTRLQWWRSIAS